MHRILILESWGPLFRAAIQGRAKELTSFLFTNLAKKGSARCKFNLMLVAKGTILRSLPWTWKLYCIILMIGFCCFQTQTFQMVNTNIVKILILLVQGNYLLSPFQLFSSGWKELNADMGQDRNSLLPRTEIIWIPLIQIFTSIHNINWDTCNRYEYAFPGRSPHLLHLPSV